MTTSLAEIYGHEENLSKAIASSDSAEYPYAGVLEKTKQESTKQIEGASAPPSVIERKPWT